MGIYLNPSNEKFQRTLNSKIYVDKSQFIVYTNSILQTNQQYMCVSRPRRFGKSVTFDMLAAYYGCQNDSHEQFDTLKIAQDDSYEKHLNKYNVISINMQEFSGKSKDIYEMLDMLVKSVYNPKAVVEAVLSGVYDSYWTKTETYEALRCYIEMNYDGLKDMVYLPRKIHSDKPALIVELK